MKSTVDQALAVFGLFRAIVTRDRTPKIWPWVIQAYGLKLEIRARVVERALEDFEQQSKGSSSIKRILSRQRMK